MSIKFINEMQRSLPSNYVSVNLKTLEEIKSLLTQIMEQMPQQNHGVKLYASQIPQQNHEVKFTPNQHVAICTGY